MTSGSSTERARGEADVSVIVITLNEERNIEECLASAKWAREIIVIDAESGDRTVEIAKTFTQQVYIRPWAGFGPQKNFGIDQASSRWICILDADERISEGLRDEICGLTATNGSTKAAAFKVPRRNYFYGRWVRWGGAYPDYQIRFFRRGCGRYNEVRLHENLLVEGEIGILQSHLDHHTEREIRDHFRKFSMYTSLAAEEKLKRVIKIRWWDLAVRPLVITFKVYVLKQGFRDGVHGLILGVFAGMFTFVKYCKVWERGVGMNKHGVSG